MQLPVRHRALRLNEFTLLEHCEHQQGQAPVAGVPGLGIGEIEVQQRLGPYKVGVARVGHGQ